MNNAFEYVPSPDSEVIVIKINEGEYAGVSYTIGGVSFPEDDAGILKFDYNIIDGAVANKEAFEMFIGDAFVDMIVEGLKDKSIIYKGGTE